MPREAYGKLSRRALPSGGQKRIPAPARGYARGGRYLPGARRLPAPPVSAPPGVSRAVTRTALLGLGRALPYVGWAFTAYEIAAWLLPYFQMEPFYRHNSAAILRMACPAPAPGTDGPSMTGVLVAVCPGGVTGLSESAWSNYQNADLPNDNGTEWAYQTYTFKAFKGQRYDAGVLCNPLGTGGVCIRVNNRWGVPKASVPNALDALPLRNFHRVPLEATRPAVLPVLQPSPFLDPLSHPVNGAEPDPNRKIATGLLPLVSPNPWRVPSERPEFGRSPRARPRPGQRPQVSPWSPRVPSSLPSPGATVPVSPPAVSYAPGQNPVAVPPAGNQPPARAERERKFRGNAATRFLLSWAVNGITESLDVVNAAYKAIPFELRKELWKAQRGKISTKEKIQFVWENWDKIEGEDFVKELVKNQIEDFLIGKAGQATKRAGDMQDAFTGMRRVRGPGLTRLGAL